MEKYSWEQELSMARKEILEQDDRLTLLSQQLAGTKASCILYAITNDSDIRTSIIKPRKHWR